MQGCGGSGTPIEAEMELLDPSVVERGPVLDALAAGVARATTGRGSLVFLAGEAGIGKTTVVDVVVRHHGRRLHKLIGACDALSTPHPLGPLRDMARTDAAVAELFDGRPRHELFAGFLQLLARSGRPALVVLEDVHWADAATLDLLRFVGRRVARCHALVIATHRSDDIGPDDPLRAVLGDLATVPETHRHQLVPLTVDGVAALTGKSRADPDVAELHRRTGGNPFFVSEILADPGSNLPDSIRDAVLARRKRISPEARQVLDVVSIVPGAIERWLLEAVASPAAVDVDACITAGMLESGERGDLAFRHELARLATEGTLPPLRRSELHAEVVRALRREQADPDPARIVHHADAAGDRESMLLYAPRAASRATERGALRQARDHLARALRYADDLPPAEHASLLERSSSAAGRIGDVDASLSAADEAVELRRACDDNLALGAALAERAGARYSAGLGPEAHQDIHAALALLTPLGETAELATAYGVAVTLAMLARDYDTVLEHGGTAIDLAGRLGVDRALVHALNSLGSTEVLIGRHDDGEEHLLASIEVARRTGKPGAEATGWSNLGSGFGEVRVYDRGERYLERAIALGAAHDLDGIVHYATAWLARVCLETGRWDRAAQLATSIPIELPGMSPIITITAATVLGRLRARRGDPGAHEALESAWLLALETDDLQRLWPVAAARGETALLAECDAEVAPLVTETFRSAVEIGHPWAIGELGLLLHRADALDQAGRKAMERAAEPYRLQVAGHIEQAAAAWALLPSPYEQADALRDGDEDQQRDALAILDELGAAQTAAQQRRRMRASGIRAIPRGPRPSTAAHPAGLTQREVQVLELVAQKMTNAEIAQALFISTKTAGNHVSSILRKLGVETRHDAVRVVEQG
jgi:DNA-binding CsgD family transcriptional regulator/tetratricopeptide (TPR) repeat protein